MCTIWEMAETIRAEERDAAARADTPRVTCPTAASLVEQSHHDENDAAPPGKLRAGKQGRVRTGLLAIAALFAGHRQREQN